MEATPAGPRRPNCSHCGSLAMLVRGWDIWPGRPDLADKPVWQCPACPDAHVGCHPGGDHALGTPADAPLRKARVYVHRVLDPLWKNAVETGGYTNVVEGQRRGRTLGARHRVYAFLAARLGIDAGECHIAMFDIERCREAYRILRATQYPEIRAWAQQGNRSKAAKRKPREEARA